MNVKVVVLLALMFSAMAFTVVDLAMSLSIPVVNASNIVKPVILAVGAVIEPMGDPVDGPGFPF